VPRLAPQDDDLYIELLVGAVPIHVLLWDRHNRGAFAYIPYTGSVTARKRTKA